MVKKEDILALVIGDKIMFPSVGDHPSILPTNFYEVVRVIDNADRVDIELKGFMKDAYTDGLTEQEKRFHILHKQFNKGINVLIVRKNGDTNFNELDFEL